MRKLLIAGATGLILAALGAVAIAQATTTWPSLKVTPTVSPDKAGTPAHPQPVKLKTVIHWQTLGEADQPVVTHFLVYFPKGSLYNGGKVTKCSLHAVSQGPQACPKASIMGSGTGTAYADTTLTHPQITVVNGGANVIYFYTVLNNPARVQQAVIGHLKKLSGKWGYSLAVTVPQDLLVVAGVPIELTELTVTAGKGNWLETTSCGPGRKWPFSVTTNYENPNLSPGAAGATGQSSYTSSVACKR